MNVSISFCTVSMNRLHHLMLTLPANISDNLSYENLVHIVLDYNSTDGTEEWIKSNLGHYILSGRLIYYRNPQPERFNMAHSKNMAVRLSNSDYVCLIDADNYTGRGYAEYAASIFCAYKSCFITTISNKRNINQVDVLGRVCFKRADYETIEGFDEFMNNYGYDDFDFCNRLQRAGAKRILLQDKK